MPVPKPALKKSVKPMKCFLIQKSANVMNSLVNIGIKQGRLKVLALMWISAVMAISTISLTTYSAALVARQDLALGDFLVPLLKA